MSLLLQLGCLERGHPLSLAAFSPTDRAICLDLAHLGLLLPFWCATWLALASLAVACLGGSGLTALWQASNIQTKSSDWQTV